MLLRRTALIAAAALSGCSLLPDHSLDYRKAPDLPALRMAEGQVAPRTIQPLYAIPEAKPSGRIVTLTEKDGRRERFAVPAPEPLTVVESPAQPVRAEMPAAPSAKPRLISDGNGYPLMQADGDTDRIWDSVGKALAAGRLGVEDRNQSLGVYYLKALTEKTGPLQLKVTRTSGGCLLSLQLNEDTVADPAIARQLFDKLLENWPG